MEDFSLHLLLQPFEFLIERLGLPRSVGDMHMHESTAVTYNTFPVLWTESYSSCMSLFWIFDVSGIGSVRHGVV
jgi:hypothetical protein